MAVIKEHEALPDGQFRYFKPDEWNKDFPKGLLLNPDAPPCEQRYFFEWNPQPQVGKPCYTASYVIGAQRFCDEELIIEPKMEKLDFMRMFCSCLDSNIGRDGFSKIYGVDMDAEPIQTDAEICSVLTPLLVVHFISLVKEIVAKGLRAGYVNKSENIKKIKGRIDICQNERINIMNKKFDQVHCSYSERSIDTPENRLFKKTLLFCKQFLYRIKDNEAFPYLIRQVNASLSAFEYVDERVELKDIHAGRRNNLYRDYDETVTVAKQILRHFDFSIVNTGRKTDRTPVFWIDMALLYEHYVYGLLHKAYGKQVRYQESGVFGWRPDFLHTGEKIIMDTKYMPLLDDKDLTSDIVGQLSGYARVQSFIKILNVDEETVIPCLILYPILQNKSKAFTFDTSKPLLQQAVLDHRLLCFYKLGVPLPVITNMLHR